MVLFFTVRTPCGPMRIGSGENDSDDAQFRCAVECRAARRRSVPV